MSAKAKVVFYQIFSVLLFLCALAGAVYIAYVEGSAEGAGTAEYAVIGSALALMGIAAAFDCMGGVILHELGHACCALLAGFKVLSVKIGKTELSRRGVRYGKNAAAGESTIVPKSAKGLRGKLAFVTLGGALFNLVYGGVLFALYFALPPHPALLFFVLFAPFQLATGIAALLPAELKSGRTDGEMLLGLARKKPFAELLLSLLSAQGILYRGSYRDLPSELLFSVPVVREDDPLFFALQLMRLQYCLVTGDNRLEEVIARWNAVYVGENADKADDDTASILYYCYSVLLPDPEWAGFYKESIVCFECDDRDFDGYAFALALAAIASGDETAFARAAEELKKEPLRGVREAEDLMIEKCRRATSERQ